ncbi:conserved hypothetical protein [Talaromyces stipitatus ATCC 10500]|uniref:Ima1 N-terminal domain-containing protein n=1 Tax=Talaromyces stipitatus (strain ATCC 10500 / CBS 375.48 / QM 6759 / NRRL 1006) TaxID=441959 RepID=B8LU02_TALSN|nr:uncharacterized protein TSTA_072250 [Talaromyces stipitatus ATCC 10500]EED23832.1 conserved hypothetical protein [Talaromyces stipitatus ATCC 10500]
MAPLFQRRLRCFYCGQRSASKKTIGLREWRCEHCEAGNYLDENGEITDPPITVTDNPAILNNTYQSPFESAGFDQTGLFCRKCIRNQHMLVSALAAYLPDTDDPLYFAYEQQLPYYRQKMEDNYPQVCEKCEQKVNERIRQTGYEAKADHLRRTMERSKMSRAAQKARRRNWRSMLTMAGALGYWTSVAGQLLSDLIGTCALWDSIAGGRWPVVMTFLSFVQELVSYIGYSSQDLAGIALVMGALSIWWNPKIHHKVEGLNGRILRLNQYYECQLIVMVARFAVWAWLKDSSNMEPSLPSAVHAFMILFMSVATIFSQRLVHYDTRPLVLWSNITPVVSPQRQKIVPQTVRTTKPQNNFFQQDMFQSFPLEKLGNPRDSPTSNAARLATPPLEPEDSMDWTPSVAQEIRPRFVTSKPEVAPEPIPHKSIFQGALPAAPRPPAWQLRNPIITQKPPVVPVTNVFQTRPTSQHIIGNEHNDTSRTPDAFFAPPKFFAPSDYHATTGLESLFDQTFTIRSPEDEMDEATTSPSKVKEVRKEHPPPTLLYSSIRLFLLSLSILAWSIDWFRLVPIPHDAVLMGGLILNILFTGFGLLASLNQPFIAIPRVVYSLFKFVMNVVLALCLSYNFSITFYQGGNLELCVTSLTALLAVEEALALFSTMPKSRIRKQTQTARKEADTKNRPPPTPHHTAEDQFNLDNQYSSPPQISPTLSYISHHPASVYSQTSSFSQSQPSSLGYGLYQRDMRRNHLYDDGSDASEISGGDSDAETTISSYTNKSIRNMNPFESDDRSYRTPRAPGLGSGLQGLSLDDSPVSKRVTRSQTTRRTGMEFERSRPSRRLR